MNFDCEIVKTFDGMCCRIYSCLTGFLHSLVFLLVWFFYLFSIAWIWILDLVLRVWIGCETCKIFDDWTHSCSENLETFPRSRMLTLCSCSFFCPTSTRRRTWTINASFVHNSSWTLHLFTVDFHNSSWTLHFFAVDLALMIIFRDCLIILHILIMTHPSLSSI